MNQISYFHGSPSRFSARIGYIHGCRVSTYNCYFTAAVPEQIQTLYTAAVCPHKIAIYTAAIQEPNRLYTLLPGVYKKCYLHGNRSRPKSAIYIDAGCINKIVISTAAIQEPIQDKLRNTRGFGVHIQCFITEPNRNGRFDGSQYN